MADTRDKINRLAENLSFVEGTTPLPAHRVAIAEDMIAILIHFEIAIAHLDTRITALKGRVFPVDPPLPPAPHGEEKGETPT